MTPIPDVDVVHAEPGELERKLAGLRRYVAKVLKRRHQATTLEGEFGQKFAAHMRRQAADRDQADHRRLGEDY